MKLLLVEDNKAISKGLLYALNQNGYEVCSAFSIKEALVFLQNNSFDLVILDVSLPDGDGFEFYKNNLKDIKTIFLTARDAEDDIVSGFDMGAEDYITKPFSTKELLARIKRILKQDDKALIKVKDITFDIDKMEVLKNDKVINLSSLEIKILYLLFSNLNKVVTIQSIIEHMWEWTGNDVYDNTITVYLKRIREKLDTDIIKTLKGIGYRVDNE